MDATALKRRFTDHPASVGETYGEHLAVASGLGFRLVLAGLACMVHGLLPWLFLHTASDAVRDLHQRFSGRSPAQALPARPWLAAGGGKP